MHDPQTAWHALDFETVLNRLDSGVRGLSDGEAALRLQRYGPNRLRPPPRRNALLRLLSQFHNILIYILLVSGVITLLLRHWIDSGVIFGVVMINAIIGFLQEGKAEQAMDAIRNMLSPQATVLRDGSMREMSAEQLVPGDVVMLASGDRVPADLRLFKVRELRIEEAALTGESEPVEKSVAAVDIQAVPGDRVGMAYSGTLVSHGQGIGVVVTTGDATEIGRISALLAHVETLTTPLLRKLEHFGRQLTVAILALAGLTFVIGVFIHDLNTGDMFLAAVALAVAAIPEGLPAIITITLAVGVQRMARRNVIIRRLPAVETLGSVTEICSDKTGTLTRNEMTVQNVVTANNAYAVSGVGYAPHGGFGIDGVMADVAEHPALREIARAALLCNDASLRQTDNVWQVAGDPTEGALLTFALKAGMSLPDERSQYPRLDIIPFESQHRFMATLHHDHAGHHFVYVKGAPEQVLEMCGRQRADGIEQPLDPRVWHERVAQLAAQGKRVLAIALKPCAAEQETLQFADVKAGLTLLGIVGIIDPPRAEAMTALAQCRSAGIRVKMITGDHRLTAQAIGVQLGLAAEHEAVTGGDLESLDERQLRALTRKVDVFARTSPTHKLRLVEALQADGAVVAMTGDGVNDAPALKRADIGVAMGMKGTEVAKEAAEMVLVDDNFASIVAGVEEGRTVDDNIRKAMLFILPTNVAEAMLVVVAVAQGLVLPMTPAQILWVNMITAVTLALALAFEPGEPNVMRRAPRDPASGMLSPLLLWRLAFVSAILVAGTYGLFLWEEMHGAAREHARTVAVNTLVVYEAFYLFNTRYLTASAFNRECLTGNRYVLIAIAIVIGMQMIFTYLPVMQALFHTVSLGAGDWARIVLVCSSVYVFVELEKAWLRRRTTL